MKKFVIVNDELRIGDVENFQDLYKDYDENRDNIKSFGLWKIDNVNKNIFFYGGLEPCNIDDIRNVKNKGFYTPQIKEYSWFFSNKFEPIEYIPII